MYTKTMTPDSSPLLLERPTVSRMPSNKNSTVHTSCRGHHPVAFGLLLLLSTLLLFSSHGGDTEAAPPPAHARAVDCPVGFIGSFAGGYVGAASRSLLDGGLDPRTQTLPRRPDGRERMSARQREGERMAAAGEQGEEKMELAAEVSYPNEKQATNVLRSIHSQLARCCFTSGATTPLLSCILYTRQLES